MKLREVALDLAIILASPVIALSMLTASASAPTKLFFHIKHGDPYPNTLGKVQQIVSAIRAVNKTGLGIGLMPQATPDTLMAYYAECGSTPVMLTAFSSDGEKLTLEQINAIMSVCNVQWLRFHEILSAYSPFPTDYVLSVLELAKQRHVPVFWNEWNTYTYPDLANIIKGFEDNVAVSFGTNSDQYEPVDGFALLQRFQRRAASVQSWYWWERNGRQDGYEFTMPPELMVQHTQQAFQAGCEIVQYEPFGYFFNNDATPRVTLEGVIGLKL